MLQISSLSTVYVGANVYITKNGESYDPTDDDVQIAIITLLAGTQPPGPDPGVDDWVDAVWTTASSVPKARVLVGPDGGLDRPVATYFMWVKIFDTPETLVLPSGQFEVV